MNHYAAYIQERLGQEIIETAHGFVIYCFPDPKTVYIVDIYVVPAQRQSGVARDIADKVMRIAKEQGCTRMIGSVVPSARGSFTSMKVLIGYGMTLQSSAIDFVVFGKDI